jgi:MmgE/PrpD N-terminal domain
MNVEASDRGAKGSAKHRDGYVVALVEAALGTSAAVGARTDEVAWSLFDFVTCAVAGERHVPAGWRPSEPGRLAVAAHADDRDDIHWGSLVHPGAVIWPAVIVTARTTQASGDAIARSAALGHELVTRLALALGAGHRRFWHSTTTCGVAGAAAATASLLTSDVSPIAHAVGHATSIASGSSRSLFERSGTRLLHRAHAVDAGIASAMRLDWGLSMRMGCWLPCGQTVTRPPCSNGASLRRWPRSRRGLPRLRVGRTLHARPLRRSVRSPPSL